MSLVDRRVIYDSQFNKEISMSKEFNVGEFLFLEFRKRLLRFF
jgi:hypothetical protein